MFEKQNNCFACFICAAINGPLIHPVAISIHITNGDKMTSFSLEIATTATTATTLATATATTTTTRTASKKGCRKKTEQIDSLKKRF